MLATHITRANEFEYATAADFCEIFSKDMNSLYLLSLLLAGDHERAEQCFLSALENATSRRTVFKEWARSWARRAVVQSAQCLINPQPRHADEVLTPPPVASSKNTPRERVEVAAVLALEPFDRFVFVMSVLERYSDHECAILLGTTRREVIETRSRALEQLGHEVESRLSRDRVDAAPPALPDGISTAPEFHAFARSA